MVRSRGLPGPVPKQGAVLVQGDFHQVRRTCTCYLLLFLYLDETCPMLVFTALPRRGPLAGLAECSTTVGSQSGLTGPKTDLSEDLLARGQAWNDRGTPARGIQAPGEGWVVTKCSYALASSSFGGAPQMVRASRYPPKQRPGSAAHRPCVKTVREASPCYLLSKLPLLFTIISTEPLGMHLFLLWFRLRYDSRESSRPCRGTRSESVTTEAKNPSPK